LASVDDRVTGIDDGVTRVDDLVARVDDRVQQTANDVDEVKRSSSNVISTDYGALPILSGDQMQENFLKWLSPPDPTVNHNIACDSRQERSNWFLQSKTFEKWKSEGSLLWIHGKRISVLLPSWLDCSPSPVSQRARAKASSGSFSLGTTVQEN
jgi:hypothetical protein